MPAAFAIVSARFPLHLERPTLRYVASAPCDYEVWRVSAHWRELKRPIEADVLYSAERVAALSAGGNGERLLRDACAKLDAYARTIGDWREYVHDIIEGN